MGLTALVLSGPLGLGHEMPVRSFRDVLQRAGWQVRTGDSMALLGSAAGRAGQRVFDRLMTVPGVYDGLHFAELRTGSRVARLAERAAARRVVPALRAELDRAPVDLVLSVFATGALAAATLKTAKSATGAATPAFQAVVYCPDVAAHKMWVHEGTDLFLVSSPAAAASVRRFRPRAPIALVPSPVRAAFYEAPSQRGARAALGLPADTRCVLLIDSGWGFAPLAGAAARLAAAGVHVLAVAGRNAEVERQLRELAATRPSVLPFGFTDRVPELMAAADVVVALPGAATCAEARVVGRRLLLLDVMPGHGRDNLLHELEQGNAEVCGPSASDVTASALAMLDANGLDGARPQAPRAPRWEPAFAAALQQIGLEVKAEEPDAHPVPEPAELRRLRRRRRRPVPGEAGDPLVLVPDLAGPAGRAGAGQPAGGRPAGRQDARRRGAACRRP
jgi:processive 1,2-diacylglycerol beta-glucosyltransferase